jgi:2-polyprenyl-3-methyl-5-hydroxy-6-metoxy-1,4-benzoquinol methylase
MNTGSVIAWTDGTLIDAVARYPHVLVAPGAERDTAASSPIPGAQAQREQHARGARAIRHPWHGCTRDSHWAGSSGPLRDASPSRIMGPAVHASSRDQPFPTCEPLSRPPSRQLSMRVPSTMKSALRAVPGLPQAVRRVRKWRPDYPRDAVALRASELYTQWWYYNIELLPGVVTNGQYESSIPMLPRLMLRKCSVEGRDCLDMGSMEGLIPALLARRGARRVLATDAIPHCEDKLAAVQHYHDVRFEYQSVGLMYELNKKLPGQSFDLINCSGLLYHVISPFHVLAGVRPLLKRNGLIVISTNVVCTSDYVMEFNNAGRLQDELNTFWYMSVPLMDYLLRYLRLAPLDVAYLPHDRMHSHIRYRTDKNTGFMSVVCRAIADTRPTEADAWMAQSARLSWESTGLVDWARAERNAESDIAFNGPPLSPFVRSDTGSLDLFRAVTERPPVGAPARAADTHALGLDDPS